MPYFYRLINDLMEQRKHFIHIIVKQKEYIKYLEEELKQLKNLKNNIDG